MAKRPKIRIQFKLSTAFTIKVKAMPARTTQMKGPNHSSFFPDRISSIKTLEKAGIKKPVKVMSALISIIKATEGTACRKRLKAKAHTLFGFPSFLKLSAFSKRRTIPAKERSNSSKGTATLPFPGSLITALFFLNPFKTTKWLKFQWMIAGTEISRKAEGSTRYPEAFKP